MKRWHVLLPILYTALVTYYSLVPQAVLEGVPVVGPAQRIWDGFVVHLLSYTAMAFLWRWAALSALGSVVLSTLIGAVLELLQALTTTGRSPSITDGLANFIGSVIGASPLIPRLLKALGISSLGREVE